MNELIADWLSILRYLIGKLSCIEKENISFNCKPIEKEENILSSSNFDNGRKIS